MNTSFEQSISSICQTCVEYSPQQNDLLCSFFLLICLQSVHRLFGIFEALFITSCFEQSHVKMVNSRLFCGTPYKVSEIKSVHYTYQVFTLLHQLLASFPSVKVRSLKST